MQRLNAILSRPHPPIDRADCVADTTPLQLVREKYDAKIKDAFQYALEQQQSTYSVSDLARLTAFFFEDSTAENTNDLHILTLVMENKNYLRQYIKDQDTLRILKDQIATALYNAARDYYKVIWKRHRNDRNALNSEIEKFNKIFVNIAEINNDYSLNSIDRCRDVFRAMKLEEIERFVSQLQERSKNEKSLYETLLGMMSGPEQRDAIYFINYRLNKAEYKNGEMEQFVQFTGNKLEFTQALHDQLSDSDSRVEKNSIGEIINKIKEGDKEERKTESMKAPNLVTVQDAHSDKPKHTGVKAGAGISIPLLIGGFVIAGLALGGILFPVLPIAVGVGVGVLAVAAVIFVIGKVIDTHRNKNAAHKDETLSNEFKTEEAESDEKLHSEFSKYSEFN